MDIDRTFPDVFLLLFFFVFILSKSFAAKQIKENRQVDWETVLQEISLLHNCYFRPLKEQKNSQVIQASQTKSCDGAISMWPPLNIA